MQFCGHCGTEAQPEARFCSSCGFALRDIASPRCASCGEAMIRDARFCHACGFAVPGSSSQSAGRPTPTPSPPSSETLTSAIRRHLPAQYVQRLVDGQGHMQGERRIVTMLFCDVKGSTAMAENLDPEEVMEIMNGAFDVLIEPIARYGGTLARLMGDAILAFFGAPLAHENDAERACRAALDILSGVRRYAVHVEEQHGIPGFAVRVGINTGLVVVGEVGADLRVEYTAMGDAVNLAARMESLAEPGSILLTGETHSLVSHLVKSRALGPVQVKGKQEPVHVYRLLGMREKPSRSRGRQRSRLPLTGRESELRTITEVLRRLRTGKGARIAVAGDTGLGKTRLALEARRSVRREAAWIDGKASAIDAQSSYWVARQVLRGIVSLSTAGKGSSSDGRGLSLVLEDLLQEQAAELRSPLALLLGESGNTEGSGSPNGIPTDFSSGRLAAAVRSLLAAAAARQPLVILLDDFHWADQSSYELLHRLLPLADDLPIVFFMLYRISGDRGEDLHRRCHLTERNRWTAIELKPLERESCTQMLDGLLTEYPLPEDVRLNIIERTEGNPFFLEEMVRQLLESGGSARAGKGGSPSPSPGTSTLPATLQAVIMTRIDSLEPEDRRSLQTASVIGRTFQQSILEQVIDPPGQDLSRSLEELLRRDFLRPVDTDNSSASDDHPPAEYAFAHTLTHEMAYTSLLLARRRELHGRIAETIEALHGTRGEEHAGALAYHYEAAGMNNRAFPFLLKAADTNRKLFANHEAIVCYEKALEFAAELGSDSDTTRGIHEGLGDVLTVQARYPQALQHYELARELAQHPQQRTTLLRKMGEVLERTGRYDESVRHLEAALAELRADFDTAEAARVYTDLGLVHYRRGEFTAAIELNLLALDLMTGGVDRRGMARVWNNLGIAYAGSGDFVMAEEFHTRALSLWNELGDTHGRAASHNNLGMLCSQHEKWDEAREHFEKSLTLCEQMGNLHGLARICDNLGELHARRGDTAAGMEYLQKAVSLLASIGSESSDGMPEMWLQSGTW